MRAPHEIERILLAILKARLYLSIVKSYVTCVYCQTGKNVLIDGSQTPVFFLIFLNQTPFYYIKSRHQK